MWAIIGGSGFEKFEQVHALESLDRTTPFGEASSGLKKVRVNNTDCLFLSRHGQDHELLPSEVNYRANIYALKKHGARRLLAFSAVGSLRKEIAPGDMVVVNQFIDATKSVRAHTFLGEGVVGHVSLANPTCLPLKNVIRSCASRFTFQNHFDKTSLCIEGPCYSTHAESLMYRQMGADVVGMTSFPEYALAREAGLCFLPCVFVTDYDCWDPNVPHVTLAEVMIVMRQNNSKAFHVLETLLSQKDLPPCTCAESGIKNALLTAKTSLSERARARLAPFF